MVSELKKQFKQTEVGMIPEEWTVKSLAEIAQAIYYGKMPEKTDLVKDGYPIFSGYKITGYHKKYTSAEPKLILVARGVGGTGKIKIAPPYTFITNLSIVIDLKNNENLQYLFYFFHKGLRYLDSGSAQSQITISDLKQVKIALPSLFEQRTIAKIFTDIDSKIGINKKIIETLDAIGIAIFKRWFVDFEFPNTDGNPYKSAGGVMEYSPVLGRDIPEGWRVGKIADLCLSISNGGTPKRSEISYWNGNIAWFKTGELTDGPLVDSEESITIEGLKNSACKLWDVNTILIALYGATIGKLGILKIKAAANQACSALVAKEEVGYPFLFYSLLVKKTEFVNLAAGAAQQNISQQIVQESKTIIPPDSLLRAFRILSFNLFEKQTALIIQNKTLSQIKESLLPKILSGKIRMPLIEEKTTEAP